MEKSAIFLIVLSVVIALIVFINRAKKDGH